MTKYNEMKQELEDWSRIITFLKVYYQTLNTETIEQHLVQALRTKPAMNKEDVKEKPLIFKQHILDDGRSMYDVREKGSVVGDINVFSAGNKVYYDVFCETYDGEQTTDQFVRFSYTDDYGWSSTFVDGFVQRNVDEGIVSYEIKNVQDIMRQLGTLVDKC